MHGERIGERVRVVSGWLKERAAETQARPSVSLLRAKGRAERAQRVQEVHMRFLRTRCNLLHVRRLLLRPAFLSRNSAATQKNPIWRLFRPTAQDCRGAACFSCGVGLVAQGHEFQSVRLPTRVEARRFPKRKGLRRHFLPKRRVLGLGVGEPPPLSPSSSPTSTPNPSCDPSCSALHTQQDSPRASLSPREGGDALDFASLSRQTHIDHFILR